MKAPYCQKGSRRCPITKKCVKKTGQKMNKCDKGTRKCANSKCYKKRKSVKSRKYFYKKYGK
jgi:hypothetical protein